MRHSPTRSRRRAGVLALAVLPLSLLLAGTAVAAPSPQSEGAPAAHSQAGGAKSPVVESRVKDAIKKGQRTFRDLNDNGRLDAYEDWRRPTADRAADLVSQMTLEEKAGLMQISSLRDNSLGFIAERNLRHFIIRDNPTAAELAERNNTFQEAAEASRLGIPVVMTSNPRNNINLESTYGVSEAGGEFSVWPGELGLAAGSDPEAVEEFGRIAAREWRAAGVHKLYGYMADVATEPRWTRVDGTFGENPDLAAGLITSTIKGFQGEELSKDSVAMTTKHFPGGGARKDGRDPHFEWGQDQFYPTEGSLYDYHMAPFKAAVDAGTSSIMPYYSKPVNEGTAAQLPKHLWFTPEQQFEEVGFAYNERMLGGLLRGDLGFDGYVNSDSGVLEGMPWGVEDLTKPERFAKAIHAGTSIFSDHNDPSALIEAVQTGLLEESELDPSVTFLVSEMFDLGLFENPYTDPEQAQRVADSPDSQAKADEAHRKSVTLLRNDQDLLPLTDEATEEIKLYVEVFTAQGADVESQNLAKRIAAHDPAIRIVDSLEEATHAFVFVRPGLNLWRDDTPDNILSVDLGEKTGIDVERIKEIEAAVPTILNVNLTNPWVLDQIEPGAAAVTATYNAKIEAVVDVLRGKYNPQGKLPITLPASQQAVLDNAPDVPGYAEDFDYAYTNAAGDDYAFGFGLSYGR